MKSESIDNLTTLRGILAIMIVFYHYNYNMVSNKVNFSFLSPIFQNGYYAVDGFFTLSGFVISYAYMDKLSRLRFIQVLKFLILRLARIYPVHILTLFFYAIVLWGFNLKLPGNHSLIDFVYNVLLINSWGVCKDFNWNGPSWSISSEWFLYLVFPFLAAIFHKLKNFKTNILLILLVLFNEFYIKQNNISAANFFLDRGIIRGFFQFLYGILAFRIYVRFPKKHVICDYCSVIIFLCLLSIFFFSPYKSGMERNNTFEDGVVVLNMMLIIFFLSKCNGFILKLFSLKILQTLGLISYSLYMIHLPLSQIMEYLMANTGFKSSEVIILLYTFLLVSISYMIYKFIELPVRNLIKEKISFNV